MVRSVVADMGDLDQVRAAAAQVRETVGHLDVLVHNAGALSARRVRLLDTVAILDPRSRRSQGSSDQSNRRSRGTGRPPDWPL